MGSTVHQSSMQEAVNNAISTFNMKDKICLVHDIFDFSKYPKNYYTPENPLEAKKIDPV